MSHPTMKATKVVLKPADSKSFESISGIFPLEIPATRIDVHTDVTNFRARFVTISTHIDNPSAKMAIMDIELKRSLVEGDILCEFWGEKDPHKFSFGGPILDYTIKGDLITSITFLDKTHSQV